MLQTLDARAARRWAVAALTALGEAREEIDALNVFPVPDGDTGTNLYLTVEAACAAVLAVPSQAGAAQVVEAFARGALLGACGNSGIIAAQLLRGWADVLAERGVLDGAAAKEAVRRADEQAWLAVADPVEGTILSVSRASAQAAASASDDLPDVVSTLAVAAREALARTPGQLAVLGRAGVVDAGGRGYVVLLEALDDLVHDRLRRTTRARRRAAEGYPRSHLHATTGSVTGPIVGPIVGPRYEVMYVLEAADDRLPGLRSQLSVLGDSVVVVGGDGLWQVHAHVDDPGAAIEAGVDAGRPRRIRVTHFADASGPRSGSGAGCEHPVAVGGPVAVGLVACAAGPGLAAVFEQAGAVVVHAGPGRRPSTGEILDAVHRTRARSVVILPNDPDTLAVARAAAGAAREGGVRVSVLPTRAQVQGLAAAAVHDPHRHVDDDVVRMSAAAGAARHGAVTVATRAGTTQVGPCREGDVLGIVQGEVAVIGRDLARVAVAVVDRLLAGGGELVTLVHGAGADAASVAVVEGHLEGHAAQAWADLEVCVLDGGQARYPLLVGVE